MIGEYAVSQKIYSLAQGLQHGGILELERERDPVAFPATPANWFWSSSPYVGYSSGAWYVYFYVGYVDGNDRGGSYYVRLVRAGQ